MKLDYKTLFIFAAFALILFLAINPMGRINNSNSIAQNPDIVDQAIDQYKTSSGFDGEVTGEVRNFGCHSEIWLFNKSNQLVAKYTVFQGRLQAIR